MTDPAGSLLNQLINWSSALLFVELNLVMPALLYAFMARRRGLLDAGCIAFSSFRIKMPFDDAASVEDDIVEATVRCVCVSECAMCAMCVAPVQKLHVLPRCVREWVMNERTFAWLLIWASVCLAIITLVLQAYYS